jgi:hypothetical protein
MNRLASGMLSAAVLLACAGAALADGGDHKHMKSKCSGEAAGVYGVKPVYVTLGDPYKTGDLWSIDGTVDQGNQGIKEFTCIFDGNGKELLNIADNDYDSAPAGTSDEVDASGTIPCSMGNGQPTTNCSFTVIREGGGSGTVSVTKTDGRTRAIFFQDGEAIGYDASQADNASFSASRSSDLTTVHIGHERY